MRISDRMLNTTVTHRVFAPSDYDDSGEFQTGTASTTEIKARIEPYRAGDEHELHPEGYRIKSMLKIFTRVALSPGDQAMALPDQIDIDRDGTTITYNVLESGRWALNFYESILIHGDETR